MEPNQPLTTDELIDLYRKDATAFAEKFAETHGEAFLRCLFKCDPQTLIDETPPNLKKLMGTPGAFFNKRRRPIPLESD